jgi:hypothetical protein
MRLEATKYGTLACIDGSVTADATTRFAARKAVPHDVPTAVVGESALLLGDATRAESPL